jgi:hypothetical protein
MFGSLVRWFAGENNRSQLRGTRFVPQMEALGIRATPGGLSGGVVASRGFVAKPTVGAESVVIGRQSGEEIPQTLTAVHATSPFHMDGSKPGVVSGSNAEVLTEMPTHGVWVGGQTPHGTGVSPFGGISGGVL